MKKSTLVGLFTLFIFTFLSHASQTLKTKPSLIIQLTIDQFAGNQLARFKSHIKKGGFAYLINHGIWYTNAHHWHATTQTAVGHTTLATGTVPAIHGIMANHWWNKEKQKDIYAMEDNTVHIIGDKNKNANQYGRSPKNMLVPSFADALGLASHDKAKRFAVSTKDRGAIPLAGHTGKAFWFDDKLGKYTSSNYYYKTLPNWVNTWNKKELPLHYLGASWQPKEDCENYIFCNKKNTLKHKNPDFHFQFPHPYGNKKNQHFNHLLTRSPASDHMTLDFAKAIIKNEHLGKNKETDYLSVSLSATDAIGHAFGPNSMESEDNFMRLDKELASFFSYVDKTVGLKNTIIVLSADHGAPPAPNYLSQFHYPAFEVTLKEIATSKAVKAVLEKYQLKWSTFLTYRSPALFTNDNYLKQHRINKDKLLTELSEAIARINGLAFVFPIKNILNEKIKYPLIQKLLENQIYEARAGDIYLIPKPYCAIAKKAKEVRANHGTPWQYDTHVPIIIAHPSIKKEKVQKRVHTIDIAPTLAALLNIDPPAASMGNILKELNIA